jgi:hypothetical protein
MQISYLQNGIFQGEDGHYYLQGGNILLKDADPATGNWQSMDDKWHDIEGKDIPNKFYSSKLAAANVSIDINKFTQAQLLQAGLSTLGSVTGIIVAVKRKSGFWGGAGWMILGGLAGSATAAIINSTKKYTK